MVNIQTYKHISRYIWLSSQVFRGIAAPKFQEDRSVLRWQKGKKVVKIQKKKKKSDFIARMRKIFSSFQKYI